MSGMLLACLLVYVFLAVSVFKSDKTELIFELNKNQVSNLAHELEAALSGAAEKLKLYAYLTELKQKQLGENLLTENADLVHLSLYKSPEEPVLAQAQNEVFLETYGLDKENFYQKLQESRPIPFEKILQQGEVVWNASLPDSPPLIGIGRTVILEDEKNRFIDRRIVVGYVKTDRLLRSFSSFRLSEVFLTNNLGELLLHSNPDKQKEGKSLASGRLFEEAATSKTKVKVIALENSLAALSKAYQDQIFIFSESSNDVAFQVVQDLMRKTFIVGSLIITIAMLIAVLMSRRLTQNISLLADRMHEVSEGNLSDPIHLVSEDETAILARTFNQMIVDLKASRDHLEEMNRELDKKVKERTRQLEMQGQKMKEIQDALIRTTRLASAGEVAGRTAHEVLNPLTNMLNRIQVLEKRSKVEFASHLALLNEIQAGWLSDFSSGGVDLLMKNLRQPSALDPKKTLLEEDLGNLKELADHLGKLAQEFLSDSQSLHSEGQRISRIVNGMRKLNRQQSDLQNHSLHHVLQDCFTLFEDQFQNAGFECRLMLNATDDLCRVDRDEFLQAISNLVRNSMQALDHGDDAVARPRLLVRTANEQGFLVVEIEDNGMGIEPEHQDRLFDQKFTTKGPEEGTGLGLSISRRFIRNFGGELEFVESIPHEKTLFRLRIPLVAKDKGAAA
jgi:signal transduction histidine kinase